MRAILIMLIALGIDRLLGWPAALFRRIGHPVSWIGAMIAGLDRRWNRETDNFIIRRMAGVVTATGVITIAAGVGWLIESRLPTNGFGLVVAAILAWPLLAARSLSDHVQAVAHALEAGDLASARQAVAMIVGRNPDLLDEAGVARAAIETLAENTSDGVIAPLFWGALLGLPGIAAYKAINTLDSMIGYRTPRHEAFGWASARLDDGANYIPARMSGLLFCAAAPASREAWSVMFRDAHCHRSPNAGWPEAAMAGALGVRLSGPRLYHDRIAEEPWLNGAARDPDASDVVRALRLYRRVLLIVTAILALLVVVLAMGR